MSTIYNISKSPQLNVMRSVKQGSLQVAHSAAVSPEQLSAELFLCTCSMQYTEIYKSRFQGTVTTISTQATGWSLLSEVRCCLFALAVNCIQEDSHCS